MNDIQVVLEKWDLDLKGVRERVFGAPTTRERERGHAI